MTLSTINPPCLQRGDTIGIIAPAGQIVDQDRFNAGISILAEMGFVPKFPREQWPGTGYLADSDQNRADEMQKAFADSEVQGVMAARGGYGCLRILDHMDFSALKNTPKMFLGFSDITIVLNQMACAANIISFHGPVLTSLCDCTQEALERLYHCLVGNWQKAISPPKLEILRGGTMATGQLVGGNLSTLMTVLGTPYDFSWQGKIVVLEDVGEPLYRIDRMLTQLAMCGKLTEIAGIILGDFTIDSRQEPLEKLRNSEFIWKRVLTLTSSSGIPVWGNFPTGHCPDNYTLPLGATAIMDCDRGALHFH